MSTDKSKGGEVVETPPATNRIDEGPARFCPYCGGEVDILGTFSGTSEHYHCRACGILTVSHTIAKGNLVFREPGMFSKEAENRLRKLYKAGGVGAVECVLGELFSEYKIERSVDDDIIVSVGRRLPAVR